jgi:hypothetical protein
MLSGAVVGHVPSLVSFSNVVVMVIALSLYPYPPGCARRSGRRNGFLESAVFEAETLKIFWIFRAARNGGVARTAARA